MRAKLAYCLLVQVAADRLLSVVQRLRHAPPDVRWLLRWPLECLCPATASNIQIVDLLMSKWMLGFDVCGGRDFERTFQST